MQNTAKRCNLSAGSCGPRGHESPFAPGIGPSWRRQPRWASGRKEVYHVRDQFLQLDTAPA